MNSHRFITGQPWARASVQTVGAIFAQLFGALHSFAAAFPAAQAATGLATVTPSVGLETFGAIVNDILAGALW